MSDRVALRRASSPGERRPGTWWPWLAGESQRVTVWCGACGRSATIDHDIAADGTVTPSLMCPYDGCGWHVFARLEGWQ
jgi:hypothetical protein